MIYSVEYSKEADRTLRKWNTPPPAPPLKEGWGEAELGPLS